jgi:hypothetical protein
MGKKKKKKVIAKRRARAQAKKPKRRTSGSHAKQPPVQYIDRPSLAAMDAPPGFREMSMTQALFEYTKPVTEYAKKNDIDNYDAAMQLGMLLWNFSRGPEENLEQLRKKIIREIRSVLKMKSMEATDFLNMMIERQEYLIPQDIQPDVPTISFVRKEQHYLIPEFNYDALNLSEEAYQPKIADEKCVQLIGQIDEYIRDGVEYEEWEDHYFDMVDSCVERFENWLRFKGVEDYVDSFSENIEIYLDFIYRYDHFDLVLLKTIDTEYVIEFFADFYYGR